MEKITDLSHLSSLMAPYLKKKHITNNFTLPAQYQSSIQQDALYYDCNETSLCLYVDKGEYYRFFYHLYTLDTPMVMETDKPLVAEVAFKGGDYPLNAVLDYFTKLGFQDVTRRCRMEMPAGVQLEPIPCCYEIDYAGKHHVFEVLKVLSLSFDKITGFLPSLQELGEAIEEKHVLCAFDNHEIVGLIHYGYKNTISTICHVAVQEKARNQKVAQSLLAQWRIKTRPENRGFIWVALNNQKARHIYEKVGFQYDGWQAATLLFHE